MRILFFIILFLISVTVRGAVTPSGASISDNGAWLYIYYTGTVATNQGHSMNLGSNRETNTAKITLTFTDYGYSAGTLVTKPNTRVATKAIRFPYYSEDYVNEWIDGAGQLVTAYALNTEIPSTATNVVVSVAANVTQSNSSASLTATNSSTISHPPVMGWFVQTNRWQFTPTGNTFILQVAGGQGWSIHDLSSLDCVEVFSRGTSGATNAVVTVLGSDFTWSPNDGDAKPVVCGRAVMDQTVFAQGEVITNYAIFKPKWGTNVVNIFTTTNTTDRLYPHNGTDQPIILTCNKNDTDTWVYAVVDINSATDHGSVRTKTGIGPAAALTDGTAITPFGDIMSALQDCGSTNNTYLSRANYTYIQIYVTNSANTFSNISLTSRSLASQPYYILKHPSVTRAQAVLTNKVSGVFPLPRNQHGVFAELTFAPQANSGYLNNGVRSLTFYKNYFKTNSTALGVWTDFNTNTFWIQNEFEYSATGLRATAQEPNQPINIISLFRGNTVYNYINRVNPIVMVGNYFPHTQATAPVQLLITHEVSSTNFWFSPFCWQGNLFEYVDDTSYLFSVALSIPGGAASQLERGAWIMNNLLEISRGQAGIPFDVSESQKTGEGNTNFVSSGNTVLGLYHPPYAFQTNLVQYSWFYQDVGNIYADRQFKGDASDGDFGPNASRTNRFQQMFGVGSRDNALTHLTATDFNYESTTSSIENRGFDSKSLSIRFHN
jgi:hypothetical protein